MAAYGLYSHIESNRRRSILLLAGLFALVYLLVYAGALAGEAMSSPASLSFLLSKAWHDLLVAAPIATIATIAWIAIAYYYHQAMIDALTGGREVTRLDEPRLYNLLENLCISRGITTPKLKVMESGALNAFATGMNEKQYAITVTTALLAQLDDPEMEAVLGHELTHIRNGDVRMLVVAVIIAGALAFFAELLFRLWFSGGVRFGSRRSDDGDRGRGGNALAVVIAVVLVGIAWALSGVIRLALSRTREYLADAGSVELTKNPDAMISALRKIEGRSELHGATSAVMEMCIDNPREEFTDLFSTHPSVEARVKVLVKLMGGHDPGPLQLPGVSEAEPDAETVPVAPAADSATDGPWGHVDETTPVRTDPLAAIAGAAALDGPWGHAPDAPRSETQSAPGLADAPSDSPRGDPTGQPQAAATTDAGSAAAEHRPGITGMAGGPGQGGTPQPAETASGAPFLPDRPPIDLGAPAPQPGLPAKSPDPTPAKDLSSVPSAPEAVVPPPTSAPLPSSPSPQPAPSTDGAIPSDNRAPDGS